MGDSIDCCVVVVHAVPVRVYVGYFIPKQQIKAKLVPDEYTQTCFHAHMHALISFLRCMEMVLCLLTMLPVHCNSQHIFGCLILMCHYHQVRVFHHHVIV